MGAALHQSLDDYFVAELDGAHQRRVVAPVSHVNSSSILCFERQSDHRLAILTDWGPSKLTLDSWQQMGYKHWDALGPGIEAQSQASSSENPYSKGKLGAQKENLT